MVTPGLGDHWHPDRATASFVELRALAVIPANSRLHDLRHSLDSVVIKSKVHMKEGAEQLGHSRFRPRMKCMRVSYLGVKTEVGGAMEEFVANGVKASQKAGNHVMPTEAIQ